MQRRNTTLLLLVLLLASVAGWVVWGGRAELPLPGPGQGPGGVTTEKPPPQVSPPPENPPSQVLPATAPRVVVEVREIEPFAAPMLPRVQAVLAGQREPLPVTVIAGLGASPFDDGRGAGFAMVAVAMGQGRLLRQVVMEREGDANLVLGPRRMVAGRVVDAQQQPVRGARVALGELDAGGAFREAVTDEDGRFELDTPAGTGVPLLGRAEGKAWQWRAISVAADARTEAELVMNEGAALPVQLACSAQAIESARLFVVPGATVSTELALYPFFLQGLSGGVAVDANGHGAIEGLPRVGDVGLVVQHPGLVLKVAQAVRLGGAGVPVVVPLTLAPLVHGRVVDEQGAPVAGAVLLVVPRAEQVVSGSSRRLQPPLLDAVGCMLTTGDAEGAFAIGETVADQPQRVLRVRAPGHAGRELAFAKGLLDAPIALPTWGRGEPSLRLLPPRAGVAWASEWNLSGGLHLVHEGDATPTVAVPRPGRFAVVVTTYAGEAVVGSRTFAALDVTGVVDVQSPQIQ